MHFQQKPDPRCTWNPQNARKQKTVSDPVRLEGGRGREIGPGLEVTWATCSSPHR